MPSRTAPDFGCRFCFILILATLDLFLFGMVFDPAISQILPDLRMSDFSSGKPALPHDFRIRLRFCLPVSIYFLYPFGISPDQRQIRPNELEKTDSSRQNLGLENGSQKGSDCRCSKAIKSVFGSSHESSPVCRIVWSETERSRDKPDRRMQVPEFLGNTCRKSIQ